MIATFIYINSLLKVYQINQINTALSIYYALSCLGSYTIPSIQKRKRKINAYSIDLPLLYSILANHRIDSIKFPSVTIVYAVYPGNVTIG